MLVRNSSALITLYFLYLTGNLCTGVGGKKKKKIMYVTTKNAGKIVL